MKSFIILFLFAFALMGQVTAKPINQERQLELIDLFLVCNLEKKF
jgi:hypothetical protein